MPIINIGLLEYSLFISDDTNQITFLSYVQSDYIRAWETNEINWINGINDGLINLCKLGSGWIKLHTTEKNKSHFFLHRGPLDPKN